MRASLSNQIALLRKTLSHDYTQMLREPGGALAHPFIVPGSAQYLDQLWDWDSWLTNIALRQIVLESEDPDAAKKLAPYERGCVINFLGQVGWDGWMPILIPRSGADRPSELYASNMHKPCIAQHAAFLVKAGGGNAEWLRESFFSLQAFVNNYRGHHFHAPTGLYFWQNDHAIGVDNDPCTFGRPPRSSGSIFLNCLMLRELHAVAYIGKCLTQSEVAAHYESDAEKLLNSIREHCWDEWTGFYYSVDLNLSRSAEGLHPGAPLDWPCLIQRIGVWSGFLALWAGVATPEQARRMAEHYDNPLTFGAPAGVRTLSKLEKMYSVRATGNPSSWLGPVWGVANYLTFRGFVSYGLDDAARDLCDKTISLFARDLERFGALHEYYEPESGEPLLNRGFQNWNYLVLNMAAWREGRAIVTEF